MFHHGLTKDLNNNPFNNDTDERRITEGSLRKNWGKQCATVQQLRQTITMAVFLATTTTW